MNRWSIVAAAGVCVLVVWYAAAARAAEQGSNAVPRVVVLDDQSVWRAYHVLKPPVIRLESGLKTVTTRSWWLDEETAAVPADWNKPEFADATWLRGGAESTARTPYLAELYLRAKFEVTDPALVKDLRLSLTYYGGAIVYVNGQEVARGHLDAGAAGPAMLADGYPLNAFVTDKGDFVSGFDWQASKEALAARARQLSEVAVAASILRRGVNDVAIEIVRAPYDKIVEEKKGQGLAKRDLADHGTPYDLTWNTCEIRKVRLTADSGDPVTANVSRPKGFQVWNSEFLSADCAADWGDPCAALRPMSLKGARNGWVSGKVVVGSTAAIVGLKARCSDLTQAAATIPASALRLRYATHFGSVANHGGAEDHGVLLDCLLESPLASFPADKTGAAVVPVWVTVKVPRDAKPGMYTGQVTIDATGEKTISVPVRLEVADFVVPDEQDYGTWVDMLESPDTLAAEYGVPPWSDEHWAMIAESLRYMGQIGAKVIYVPLICQTNSGNAESMVRWIKKPDGSYGYDFTIMDKYLDLAQKYIGKPKFTALWSWEVYLNTPKQEVTVTAADHKNDLQGEAWANEKVWAAARWDLRGKGPAVTALDPATGKTTTAYLPRFEDPASKEAWKPLFDELHRRMARRGLEQTMALAMASDIWPGKEEVLSLEEVSGHLPWITQTHGGNSGWEVKNVARVAYKAYVWDLAYPEDPAQGRLYGWKAPELYAEFRRFTSLNSWPLSSIQLFSEINITGAQRGLGRIGADFWPVLKDKKGQRRGWVWEQYPQSLWHSCNLCSYMLEPGPTGPVASVRYEAMREGVQECEARIAIERVLTDEALKAKLGADLAGRCQKLLDDRVWEEMKGFSDLRLGGRDYATQPPGANIGGGAAGHAWYLGSGWQDRAQRLYELAGEVTKKVSND